MVILVNDIINLTKEFQKREPHAIQVWFTEVAGKMYLEATANDMSKPYQTTVHRYKSEIIKDLNFNVRLGEIVDDVEIKVISKEDNPHGYVYPFKTIKVS